MKKRKLRGLKRAMDFMAQAILARVEKLLILSAPSEEDSFSRPIFVIGPPRSGTTLLYQLLVNRFHFVYLTNLASKFYAAPTIGIWLSNRMKALFWRKGLGYESNYGKTETALGPNEAGEFWYRWFPMGEYVYVPPGSIDERSIRELRSQVLGLSNRFGAPMVFKNTYSSMRIAPIIEAFPNAVFLVSKRDPLDTAQSILEGRAKSSGNKRDWWSVPPKEIDEIRQHPYWEQVVEQVYYIYKQIDEDSQRYDRERFLQVSYRALCEDTRGTLENIRMFLDERGVKVLIKGEIPESFPYSTGKKINEEEYALLRQKVNELWKV
jgi:hypothetical protein